MTIDILVVGAGHNGLVCPFYLASAGLKVKVVEGATSSGAPPSRKNPIPASAIRSPLIRQACSTPR
jgi:2-polyprenyl-6-methoxyphenol hydroxylase-like FAD-dependent oxidoreductase